MLNVTLYFQVHQPFRLKRSFGFDEKNGIIDIHKNREIFDRVKNKCYLPTTKLLIELVKKHPELKLSFSFTGTFVEQAKMFDEDALNVFKELFDTGNIDILEETYYHSLAYLIDKEEFTEQIKMHRDMIKKEFNFVPKIFRNTEAMYSNDIANVVSKLGYKGIIAEGWDRILDWRSPNYVYSPPSGGINVLLRNYRLSDDISFRFSSREWKEFPLTADKYSDWISRSDGETVNLFMDYETFGEHQWRETGILEFLKHLPSELIKRGVGFNKISETASLKSVGIVDVPYLLSWADVDRDVSAWLGNKMQDAAFEKIKKMRNDVLSSNNEELIRDWRILQTSDNFYYMCTKWFADGDIHKYFNAYDSPYTAYVNYMNIVSGLEDRIKLFRAQSHKL